MAAGCVAGRAAGDDVEADGELLGVALGMVDVLGEIGGASELAGAFPTAEELAGRVVGEEVVAAPVERDVS